MIPGRKNTNEMSPTNAPAFCLRLSVDWHTKETELKQARGVLLSVRNTETRKVTNLGNRVPRRRKMYRDRAPEICIRVMLSVGILRCTCIIR